MGILSLAPASQSPAASQNYGLTPQQMQAIFGNLQSNVSGINPNIPVGTWGGNQGNLPGTTSLTPEEIAYATADPYTAVIGNGFANNKDTLSNYMAGIADPTNLATFKAQQSGQQLTPDQLMAVSDPNMQGYADQRNPNLTPYSGVGADNPTLSQSLINKFGANVSPTATAAGQQYSAQAEAAAHKNNTMSWLGPVLAVAAIAMGAPELAGALGGAEATGATVAGMEAGQMAGLSAADLAGWGGATAADLGAAGAGTAALSSLPTSSLSNLISGTSATDTAGATSLLGSGATPAIGGDATAAYDAAVGNVAPGAVTAGDALGTTGAINLGNSVAGGAIGTDVGGAITDAASGGGLLSTIGNALTGTGTGGIGSGLGSIISGLGGAYAANKAAQTQSNASNQAAQTQLQMFNQTQQNLQPYMQGGTTAMNQLVAGTQPGGALTPTPYSNFTTQQFQQDPGYQFQLQQGQNALTNAASLTGGMNSNNLKGMVNYSQGMANTDYQNALNNYIQQYQLGNNAKQQQFTNVLAQAGMGENAAAGLGNTSAQVGSQVGNNIVGSGVAQSAGTVGTANALTGAYNNYLQNQFLNQYLNQQPTTTPG